MGMSNISTGRSEHEDGVGDAAGTELAVSHSAGISDGTHVLHDYWSLFAGDTGTCIAMGTGAGDRESATGM